jgi:uncharacterized protein with NAD-binding domain and iron-sulfur cluster
MTQKTRVAVLGGGIAAMTAAFELSRTEELRQQYEITVYQMGWRLGGKGASGRADGNGRIEEHGLHVWFGFYDNAFNMIKEVYKEANRPADQPLATFEQAFKACDQVVLQEQLNGGKGGSGGKWDPRVFTLPPHGKEPGGQTGRCPSMWAELIQLSKTAWSTWEDMQKNPATSKVDQMPAAKVARYSRAVLPPGPTRGRPGVPKRVSGWTLSKFLSVTTRSVNAATRPVLGDLNWATRTTESILSPLRWLLRLLEKDLIVSLQYLNHLVWEGYVKNHLDEVEPRQFFTLLNAGAAFGHGVLLGAPSKKIYELDDWLTEHGAIEFTLEECALVRAIYDMAFGLKPVWGPAAMQNRDMDAATAVLDMIRLFFTYHGSFYYKMEAGMGDTVFTPMYQVLKDRGVKFEFFRRVENLGLDKSRGSVESITVVHQAETNDRKDYQPLTEVEGLQCWPNQPKWSRLEGAWPIAPEDRLAHAQMIESGEPLPSDGRKVLLRKGRDFDSVVLGIPVGALPPICEELLSDEENQPFKDMIDNSSVVMTQAFQVWLNKVPKDLGCPYGPESVLTSFVEPVDTYSDMSYLIDRESWSDKDNVEGIVYFCGVLPDSTPPKIQTQADADKSVEAYALEMLEDHCSELWRSAYHDVGGKKIFDWNVLVDPAGRSGRDRLKAQYIRANFAPSERYTQTPHGSVEYRLWPEESGYNNLFLAGDWTRTPLNAGCVEGAVMSGMRAAHTLAPLSARTISGSGPDWLVPSSRRPVRPRPGASEPSVPPYAQYGGLTTVPGPFRCADAVIYAFFLKADATKLGTLFQRVFGPPAGGHLGVAPVGDTVMLSFGSMNVNSMNTGHDPELGVAYDEMGHSPETNAAVWILTESPKDMAVFVPAMWVDNPISLTGGREIYGFAKNWGAIALGPGETQFSLDVYGGDFGPDKSTGNKRLVTLTLHPEERNLIQKVVLIGDEMGAAVAEVFELLKGRLGFGIPSDEAFVRHLITELIRKELRQVYLRQFRAPAGNMTASPYDYVASVSRFETVKLELLSSRYQFSLDNVDSHPLAKELGIGSQDVNYGLKISGEFVLDEGAFL